MRCSITDEFHVHSEMVLTIVWYTIKDQSWGTARNRVEDIHVDGYLKGIPVNVTYYPNYTNNGISGKTRIRS